LRARSTSPDKPDQGAGVAKQFFCRKAVNALRWHQRGQAAGAELYRCDDRLLIYKQVVFDHVAARAA